MLYSLSVCIVFGAVVTLLTLTVQYHPAGVKPHQREAYAEKMRKVKALREIVRNADPSTSPRVTANETSYDFGMVDPHTTLSHEFEVSNGGEIPLTLAVASTSCKCTVGSTLR